MKNKIYNIPLLVVMIVSLIGGIVCAYINNDLEPIGLVFNKTNGVVVDNKPQETSDPQTETTITTDYSLINGSWISEPTEDGAFLEFDINYPEVNNFNGYKGTIKESDKKEYDYVISFEDEHLYIDDVKDDNAVLYYSNDGVSYENHLILNKKVIDDVGDNTISTDPNDTSNKPTNTTSASSNNQISNTQSSNNKKGHYEERQVLVKDAYDEQVLVKKGECTQVLVQDAYDTQEMVYLDGAYFNGDPVEVAVCNDCGAIFYDSSVVDHITNSPNCGGWHNEVIDTCEPYWHNVEYKTVHHDAVYETRCEPDVYETVHHEAVYETQKIWVED